MSSSAEPNDQQLLEALDLPIDVAARLQRRAATHGHSVLGELRALVLRAYAPERRVTGQFLLDWNERIGDDGVDLDIPPRDSLPERPVDL